MGRRVFFAQRLESEVAKGRFRTAPQMKRWVEKELGIKAAVTTIYGWLGKLGARMRRSVSDGDPRLPENVRIILLPPYSPEQPGGETLGPNQGRHLQPGICHNRSTSSHDHRLAMGFLGRFAPSLQLDWGHMAAGSSKRFRREVITGNNK